LIFLEFFKMDKIQPDQIRLDTPPMIMTNSVRFITGGNLLDKPTFGQVFMAGLKKFGSIFGRIGASLLRFAPFPGAQAASAGLYGLSNLAQQSYQGDLVKRANNLAMDEAAANANFSMVTPGFGMFGSPDSGQSPAPTGPLGSERLDTVLNREAAAQSQIGQM
jgi:hypothetical protein